MKTELKFMYRDPQSLELITLSIKGNIEVKRETKNGNRLIIEDSQGIEILLWSETAINRSNETIRAHFSVVSE